MTSPVVPKRVLVVGAGISGLSVAHCLRVGASRIGEQIHITVVDRSKRVGGWIRSDRGNDFLFEHGPRSLLPAMYPLRMLEHLEMQDRVVLPADEAKKRYVLLDGKLEAPPDKPSLFQFFFKKLGRKLWFPMLQELRRPTFPDDDMCVHDFILRRTNNFVAEVLGSAFIYGVYGGDSRTLSMRSAFPRLWFVHKKFGSIIKGMSFMSPKSKEQEQKALEVGAIIPISEEEQIDFSEWLESMLGQPMYSFRTGMQELPDRLYEVMSKDENVEFRLGTGVDGICIEGSSKDAPVKAVIEGQEQVYDHIFTTTSAKDTARILGSPMSKLDTEEGSVKDEMVSHLASVPHSSVITVNVGYNTSVLQDKGFGVLIPRSEKNMVLGITFDSCTFPAHNKDASQTRLTVMLGGGDPKHADIFQMSEEQLKEHTIKELASILKINQAPDYIKVNVNKDCIPQYPVGHYKSVERIGELLSKLGPQYITVGGTGFGGVSVNDCIDNGRTNAADYLAYLKAQQEQKKEQEWKGDSEQSGVGMEL